MWETNKNGFKTVQNYFAEYNSGGKGNGRGRKKKKKFCKQRQMSTGTNIKLNIPWYLSQSSMINIHIMSSNKGGWVGELGRRMTLNEDEEWMEAANKKQVESRRIILYF